MKSINITQKFGEFDQHWHPHQIAEVDDMQVCIAKIQGAFVWHQHDDEDELFQVIKGTLLMQFKDKTVPVKTGELIVVPKGVAHCPKTLNNEEVHVLLFEKKTVAHTGAVIDKKTVTNYPKI
jgi:mannose-6-phosphate isomerase-like protein (cupin superfamily)